MEGFEIIDLLGRGTYGRVYRAKRKIDGAILCVKQVPLDGMNEIEQQETLNEVIGFSRKCPCTAFSSRACRHLCTKR
jgi:serine/threonine protein kinase